MSYCEFKKNESYKSNDQGFINKKFHGLLFNNEIFQELKLGQTVKGYIKKIRSDYKIDVTVPNQVRPKNLKHHIALQDKVYLNWDASSAMLLKK